MTLFANILENPLDARAREDVKLMEQVVNFLSMLSVDENGGVRRMLGVCSEFERIAKAVLDRADKESASKRKRKTPEASSKISPRPFSGPALTPPRQAKAATAQSPFTPRQSFDVDRAVWRLQSRFSSSFSPKRLLSCNCINIDMCPPLAFGLTFQRPLSDSGFVMAVGTTVC